MEAIAREYQLEWQAIDVEIKSLEESFQESLLSLRRRRNAVIPISSLPTEVIAAIFSIFRLLEIDEPLRLDCGVQVYLAWLRVTHVCHQWREIALNNPLLWSRIDFANITLAGAVEMLARAKKVPLRWKARATGHQRYEAPFSASTRELQSRVSGICHLTIEAHLVLLLRTLGQLASPAPILEYLSLSMEEAYYPGPGPPSQASIPDTLFNGTTPRLSCLELRNCIISWKSPLLKGLKHLEIRSPSESDIRPSLSDWLDALDEMSQLKKVILHSASPLAPPFPFDIERTVTLPFLTHLDISSTAGECALALSHLILPVLAQLRIKAKSVLQGGGDLIKLLPYVAWHSHGPQDTRPLQNMLIREDYRIISIIAGPDANITTYGWLTPIPRLELSVSWDWCSTDPLVLKEVMAVLPLENLVMLTAEDKAPLGKGFWRYHAPRWPLLKHVELCPIAARGLRKMILEDNGGRESPLLPSLTNICLQNRLTGQRTLRLCDALMKRVEQGVPVEELDLRPSFVTNYAVKLLSEVVASVRIPEGNYMRTNLSDNDSGAEDDPESGGYSESGP